MQHFPSTEHQYIRTIIANPTGQKYESVSSRIKELRKHGSLDYATLPSAMGFENNVALKTSFNDDIKYIESNWEEIRGIGTPSRLQNYID